MNEWLYLLLSVLALGIVDGIELLIIKIMLKRQSAHIKAQIIKHAKEEALKEINKIIVRMKKYIRKQTAEIPTVLLKKIDFEGVINDMKKKISKSINMKINRISGRELKSLEDTLLSLPPEQQQDLLGSLQDLIPEDIRGVPIRDLLIRYAPIIKEKIANYASFQKSSNSNKIILP